ncbi:helix-turn-helix domain-containing protein [Streptomyces mirabilis]|uniref:helix-turn-helix domain-containing protein n=1 Tax=Streptomyces mirabilis TaxID=68239 RepID=UPI0033D0F265
MFLKAVKYSGVAPVMVAPMVARRRRAPLFHTTTWAGRSVAFAQSLRDHPPSGMFMASGRAAIRPCGAMGTMDLRDMRAFVAVVEEGALSAAARRLHMSQPRLSQMVLALEREFGVGLLVRSSTGSSRPRPARPCWPSPVRYSPGTTRPSPSWPGTPHRVAPSCGSESRSNCPPGS